MIDWPNLFLIFYILMFLNQQNEVYRKRLLFNEFYRVDTKLIFPFIEVSRTRESNPLFC